MNPEIIILLTKDMIAFFAISHSLLHPKGRDARNIGERRRQFPALAELDGLMDIHTSDNRLLYPLAYSRNAGQVILWVGSAPRIQSSAINPNQNWKFID